MKKKITKENYFQTLISLFILSVFAYMALSYGGTSQQKFQLPDGRWELAKNFGNGKSSITTGHVDENGLFKGMVTIEHEKDFEKTCTEEVYMEHGLRQGTAKLKYTSGRVDYWCFEDNEPIHKGKCEEKSATLEILDSTAYSIFSRKVPWFEFNLYAFGYDEVYMESYMDTLELLLYANDFLEEDFDDHYDDVMDILVETPYDSIIQLNNEFSIFNGLDLILRHEFRLATFDSYLRGDSNTYNVIKKTYPNYLQLLNQLETTNSDFEGFCHVYDSIMGSYSYVALSDTFIIDTLDNRIFRTLDYISSSDENNLSTKSLLKNAILNPDVKSISSPNFKDISIIRSYVQDNPPVDVASIVLTTILMQFANGDLIRKAVFEAYSMKKGIVRLPLTSIKISSLLTTSCTLVGNVIDDGGGEVSKRGIAWATYYNPTTEGNLEASGSGSGRFSVTISGLIPGTTYYARSYATNSAGTAFGNCISFVAGETTAIEEITNSDIDLFVFPNPTSGMTTFRFNLETSEKMVLTVVNLNGQVVMQKELDNMVPGENRIAINLSSLENGIYTGRLTINDSKQINRKFLVAH